MWAVDFLSFISKILKKEQLKTTSGDNNVHMDTTIFIQLFTGYSHTLGTLITSAVDDWIQ